MTMIRTSRSSCFQRTSFLDRTLYLESLQGTDILNGGILAYYPAANVNPYQSIIYNQLDKLSVRALPISREDLFSIQNLSFINRQAVLHFHWLESLGKSKFQDPKDYQRLIDSILLYKENGGKIIYTLHNTIPHSVIHSDQYSELYREVIDLRMFFMEHSDSIHVLNKETYKECDRHFKIPVDKCLTVPHPVYTHAYVDKYTLESARAELCIPMDKLVILCFGSIGKRKGLEEIISSFTRLDDVVKENTILILHGKIEAKNKDYFSRIVNAESRKNVYISTVEDSSDTVGLLFRAADYVLLNSRHNLNSGTAHLALTFEVPILSTGGSYTVPVGEACYINENMNDLLIAAHSIKNNKEDCYSDLKRATIAYKSKLDPFEIAMKFNQSVEKLLE